MIQPLKTLIIDNFDSFTYNLVQLCAELGGNPEVRRNKAITLKEIEAGNYTHIILSPGPGTPENPEDFGVCAEVIQSGSCLVPVLGVCLGHQGIIAGLGGKILRAPVPMHGKSSRIRVDSTHPLFSGLGEELEVMRYHSLIGERASLPEDLDVIAETEDGLVMAVSSKTRPLYGVQFHPESVGTPDGRKILENFLNVNTEQLLRNMAQRGESAEELSLFLKEFKSKSVPFPIEAEESKEVMDICGTGGSGLARMNLSTTVAFVLAAGGVKVAKHGNKAGSGRCGSFDLLEALGVRTELSPPTLRRSLEQFDLVFLFAPAFHPSMKQFAEIRKKIAHRTIFNLLGPLLNPANPGFQLIGTTDAKTAETLMAVLQKSTEKTAMVLHNESGLDEAIVHGPTQILELKDGQISRWVLDPKSLGLGHPQAPEIDWKKASPVDTNVQLFDDLLHKKTPGPLMDQLLLNAALAFKLRGRVASLEDGVTLARNLIQSGAAFQTFLNHQSL